MRNFAKLDLPVLGLYENVPSVQPKVLICVCRGCWTGCLLLACLISGPVPEPLGKE